VDFATVGGGTATAAADYTPVAQTITFAAGATTRTVAVPILPDTLDEPNETINLQLSNPGGGAALGPRNTAVLTIVDNDVAGTVQFGLALYTVSETATSATVTITRSGGAASAVTVDFATSDGPGASGAVAGSDYTATAATVTFAANQVSQNVVIPLPGDDALAEGNKFVTLTLSNPGGGAVLGPRSTAMLRIADNELSLAFSSPSYTVRENGSVATITIELTGVNVTPVTVNWAATGVTAQAGSDYGTRGSALEPTGMVTFAAGGTPTTVRTRTFTIPILQDTIVEGTETVTLTLTGASGAAVVVGRDTATLFISDDDVGGAVQFSADFFNANECAALPCNATLTLSRSGGAAGGVTVDFITADGTAVAGADYTTTSGTVTFAAGQMSRTISVPLVIEPGAQPLKTFSVVISNPGGGGTLGARQSAQVRITDTH
jgi:Calx-beta domain